MDAFDYDLPASVIAQQPAEPRSSARLLVALGDESEPEHASVHDLPRYVRPGDVVVVNETRVIPARLLLQKATGGRVEVLLLEPVDEPNDRRLGAAATSWSALVRPGRRVPPGTTLLHDGSAAAVVGEVLGDDGRRLVRLTDPALPARAGVIPLPPYIREALLDPDRYQTVYARAPGSVAAPTAGLHLTEEVLGGCRRAGAEIVAIDLVVGSDTFKPIKAQRPEDHVMHSERYVVPEGTRRACEAADRVIAVGTTTVRALESAAASGNQSGRTSLFIHDPYRFQVVDVLLTNFHLPRSSLLLLVDAFYGPGWRELYRRAMDGGYRFLSFGDAMLVGRGAGARR
jgi:S-adenosylmethionine:tRNA ribosyltransferase-isomerase